MIGSLQTNQLIFCVVLLCPIDFCLSKNIYTALDFLITDSSKPATSTIPNPVSTFKHQTSIPLLFPLLNAKNTILSMLSQRFALLAVILTSVSAIPTQIAKRDVVHDAKGNIKLTCTFGYHCSV